MIGMTNQRGCRFFRDPEETQFGRGIGYCDLGVIWSICDGDMKYCEKPDVMIKTLFEEQRRAAKRASTPFQF